MSEIAVSEGTLAMCEIAVSAIAVSAATLCSRAVLSQCVLSHSTLALSALDSVLSHWCSYLQRCRELVHKTQLSCNANRWRGEELLAFHCLLSQISDMGQIGLNINLLNSGNANLLTPIYYMYLETAPNSLKAVNEV